MEEGGVHHAVRRRRALSRHIQLPDFSGIKCYSVIAGSCRLEVPETEAVLLREGDYFLIAGRKGFRLATGQDAPEMPFTCLYEALLEDLPGLYDGEARCTLAEGTSCAAAALPSCFSVCRRG